MSATTNTDAVKSVSNQEGEFSSKVPPSEPLEKGGHKPGVLASEADKAGEFHVQTLPAGSAPTAATHAPQNDPEVPPGGASTAADAADAIPGATSGDVHTGLGHPGQGQTSSELRHDGSHGRAKQGGGLEGVGAAVDASAIDAHDPGFASQRALGKDVETGVRGTVGGAPAEERLPAGAEEVASEAPRDRSTRGVASEHAGGK